MKNLGNFKHVDESNETTKNVNFVRKGDNVNYGHFAKFSNQCGIYEIVCKVNGLKYVGGTSDVQRRLQKHFSELRFNRHRTHKLQKDFNEFGFDNFTYSVIKETNNLLEEEVKYQLEVGIEGLYNEKISGHYMSQRLKSLRGQGDKSIHRTEKYRKMYSMLKTKYKVGQFTSNGDFIELFENANSITDKHPEYKANSIRGACNGSKRSYKGFQWRYFYDDGTAVPDKRDE